MKANEQLTSIGLIGRHEITVLDDGRIILPSDIVHLLQAAGVKKLYPAEIPGLKALVLCPEQLWNRWVAHLETKFPTIKTHPGARAYLTPFKPVAWDSQGRISLPALASNHAGIRARGTVVIIGNTYYMELWAEDEFSKIRQGCEDALRKTDQQQQDSEDSDADVRS